LLIVMQRPCASDRQLGSRYVKQRQIERENGGEESV
jgi:hypothetical protein